MQEDGAPSSRPERSGSGIGFDFRRHRTVHRDHRLFQEDAFMGFLLSTPTGVEGWFLFPGGSPNLPVRSVLSNGPARSLYYQFDPPVSFSISLLSRGRVSTLREREFG